MNQALRVPQHVSFSVLFPGVYKLVKDALTRHFYVLQLQCVKPLLDVFTEEVTRYAVALRINPNLKNVPYIDINKLHLTGEEKINDIIVGWYRKAITYDAPDITALTYQKVFEFVSNQIFLKEPQLFFISEEDTMPIVILILRSSTINDKTDIEQLFSSWFVGP